MKRLVVIALILMVVCGSAYAEVYPKCGVVIDLDKVDDLVIVADMNGEAWEMEGVEDWMVGDVVAMVMDDNGTEYIYDDVITMAYYQGRIS